MPAELTDEVRDRVAERMVRKWRAQRSHLPDEDVRSEAIVVMTSALQRYDPAVGALEPYLYVTCVRMLQRNLTRLMQPAGSRSNDDVPALMQLRTVEFHFTHAGQDPLDYDELVYRTQVHARMVAIAKKQTEGDLVLRIMYGLTDVREHANGDKQRATSLYNRIKQMKKRMREDRILAQMMEETEL